MSGADSKLTSGSQISFENEESSLKTKENEYKTFKKYAADYLPKTSPIKIPIDASIKIQNKKDYDQVKYNWNKGEYAYVARWHTKTPNSPSYENESWVVQRIKKGIGAGNNARHRQVSILVGNKWISNKIWQEAINAKKNGTITQKQKELLKNGHHKIKK